MVATFLPDTPTRTDLLGLALAVEYPGERDLLGNLVPDGRVLVEFLTRHDRDWFLEHAPTLLGLDPNGCHRVGRYGARLTFPTQETARLLFSQEVTTP
jgi:hypothetical protein